MPVRYEAPALGVVMNRVQIVVLLVTVIVVVGFIALVITGNAGNTPDP